MSAKTLDRSKNCQTFYPAGNPQYQQGDDFFDKDGNHVTEEGVPIGVKAPESTPTADGAGLDLNDFNAVRKAFKIAGGKIAKGVTKPKMIAFLEEKGVV